MPLGCWPRAVMSMTSWLPTPTYDAWRTQDIAHRWLDLVHAWLESTRAVGLVGGKDVKDGRVNALAPEIDRVILPDIKVAVLLDLTKLPERTRGRRPSRWCVAQAWRRPRRGGSHCVTTMCAGACPRQRRWADRARRGDVGRSGLARRRHHGGPGRRETCICLRRLTTSCCKPTSPRSHLDHSTATSRASCR